MGKSEIDLTKSVDELNNVISTEEKKEEEKTVSMLAKAMKTLGLGANNVDLTKSQNSTEENKDENNETGDAGTSSKKDDELEAPPSAEDVANGDVDATEFLEKSIEYMGGVHDLVKSIKTELGSIRKENADLQKSLSDSNYALGALVNSQMELHKSMKLTTIEAIAEPLREVAAPSQAQLQKGIEEETNLDLTKNQKDCFDDAEVSILAKAMRERTITDEEVVESKRTFMLPKRLLS